jgi:hypothetical protein
MKKDEYLGLITARQVARKRVDFPPIFERGEFVTQRKENIPKTIT